MHGGIIPLLPEEIIFGSRAAAPGMPGIPDLVFSGQGGHPEALYRCHYKAPPGKMGSTEITQMRRLVDTV